MKRIAKKLVFLIPQVLIYLIELYDKTISFAFPKYRLITRDVIIKNLEIDKTLVKKVDDPSFRFSLHTPNRLCAYRADTFWTKEPEILEWIMEFGGNESVFFDVGANIGIYSIYYAKLFSGQTYSFEPSVFNLKQLAKNINSNGLGERVVIVPVPLSKNSGVALFRNGSADEGGALNAFGVHYGHDGQPLSADVEYRVVGFALDNLIGTGVIPDFPTMMKIDVDGIEHLILDGAKKILSASTLKTVFIEVNDGFLDQSSNVEKRLTEAGFVLREKRHSELLENSKEFNLTFNQIWVRP